MDMVMGLSTASGGVEGALGVWAVFFAFFSFDHQERLSSLFALHAHSAKHSVVRVSLSEFRSEFLHF